MPDRGVGTSGRFQAREAGPNRIDPERMSATGRLHEVASLLAVGFLRYWAARSVDGREKDLAILRTSSEVCHEPQSEGESL